MKEHLKFVNLLTLTVLLYTPAGFTQDNEKEAESKSTDAPASQEVEITEDNYRQFMELRDPRQQRSVLPENAFKPKTGLQKLDKLPEESQKHLRNQLREIIVQGDQWQPGDEDEHYPYVPSEAASTNKELQKQEAEAWGELVDSYHRREAEIYENQARSQAAMAPDGASNGGSNTGNGSPGDGTGQAGAGGEAGRESSPEQSSAADSYSPNASIDPNARNSAGVSQNAMEFLKGRGLADQGTNQPGRNAGSPGGSGVQGSEGQGDNTSSPIGDSAQGDAQEQAEQQASSPQGSSEDTNATASNNTEANSMAGSSQNALEFLKSSGNEGDKAAESGADSPLADNGPSDEQGDAQEQSQDGQQSSDEQQAESSTPTTLTSNNSGNESEGESTSGVSQNALEFLTGESDQTGQGQARPADTSAQRGTLSIKDLINAKGVGNANAPPPPPVKQKDVQTPNPPPPDKDGGG